MKEEFNISNRPPEKDTIYYRRGLEVPVIEQSLGQLTTRTDIPSSIPEFHWYPEMRVEYPQSIVRALGLVLREYNEVFTTLVEKNREFPTDYQYAPINYFVQIDMAGLTPDFIEAAETMSLEELSKALKERIFEIENSLAMYNFMRGIFRRGGPSLFEQRFDAALEDLRRRFGKPIALLAVTPEKYQAMLATEFGIKDSSEISGDFPYRVKELSGFDMFFGPDEFEEYLRQNNDQCDYLLYTRTSLPVTVLRDPSLRPQLQIPFLSNEKNREIVKAHSIMYNIDNPANYGRLEEGEIIQTIINDTKMYMVLMDMGYPICEIDELKKESEKSIGFARFLERRGLNFEDRDLVFRAKPLILSYGSYAHIRGKNKADFRNRLRKEIKTRGPYIIQPEIVTPIIYNQDDNQTYYFIDRLFGYCNAHNDEMIFLGGLRNMMPAEIYRTERLKVHGSQKAAWVEITD